jgi:hypothetical protein
LLAIGVQKSYANELLVSNPNMNSIIELQESMGFTDESLSVNTDKAQTEIKTNKNWKRYTKNSIPI